MNPGKKRLKSIKMALNYRILESPHPQEFSQTVIFFTTTAQEGIATSPLCHPAIFLQNHNIRVISFDLPLHNDQTPSYDGANRWTEKMIETQTDLLYPFLQQVSSWIDEHLDPKAPLGFMGISRGAFIAALLAIHRALPVPLVLFSPMQDLDYLWLWDCEQSQLPFLRFYRLSHHSQFLKDCPIYFSIGNHDERVLTAKTLHLYQELLHLKGKEQKRNIPLELHVFPSIGMYGHGTPDHIFAEGAKWMSEHLKM